MYGGAKGFLFMTILMGLKECKVNTQEISDVKDVFEVLTGAATQKVYTTI